MAKDERGVTGRAIVFPPRGHMTELQVDKCPDQATLAEIVDGPFTVVDSNYNGRPCQIIFNSAGYDAFNHEPLEKNDTATDVYIRSGDPLVQPALYGTVVFLFGVRVPGSSAKGK